jgi:uncharacterized cofD-like protein
LTPEATANPAALTAIKRADVIVIGPGDLYTSILPNLLVAGVPAAIGRSKAVKVFVCNLMTKHGETDGFRASDFLREVQRYLGDSAPLDHVIVNDGSGFPEQLLAAYALEHAYPVEADLEGCASLGPKVHCLPLAAAGALLRHDPPRLADAIVATLRRSCEQR